MELQQPETEMGRKMDEMRAESEARIEVPEWMRAYREEHHEYFDLEARPCTFGRWGELQEEKRHDPNGPWRVGADQVGAFWVSTVWVGLDMAIGPGAPVIYETMIFDNDLDDDSNWREVYTDRYPDRASAVTGHAAAVLLARNPDLLLSD